MKTTRGNRSGFTLVEAMVAMSVAVVLLGLTAGFLIDASKWYHVINQRYNQATDLRRFSQELIYTASRSNQVFLYSSVTSTDRDAPGDALVIDSSDATNILHPAGDFVVFVFYEFPKPGTQSYHRIKRLVGYYLDGSGGGIGAIRKITIDLSKNALTGASTPDDQVASYNDDDEKTMVEQVLTDNWSGTKHTQFATYSLYARGLFKSEIANEGIGRLFYYRDTQRSLMVAGQLYGTSATRSRWTYTDSFNFSVTPRS